MNLDFKSSPEWQKANRIATDEVEQYSFLPAETIYSVYVSTDPVAYCEFIMYESFSVICGLWDLFYSLHMTTLLS